MSTRENTVEFQKRRRKKSHGLRRISITSNVGLGCHAPVGTGAECDTCEGVHAAKAEGSARVCEREPGYGVDATGHRKASWSERHLGEIGRQQSPGSKLRGPCVGTPLPCCRPARSSHPVWLPLRSRKASSRSGASATSLGLTSWPTPKSTGTKRTRPDESPRSRSSSVIEGRDLEAV